MDNMYEYVPIRFIMSVMGGEYFVILGANWKYVKGWHMFMHYVKCKALLNEGNGQLPSNL